MRNNIVGFVEDFCLEKNEDKFSLEFFTGVFDTVVLQSAVKKAGEKYPKSQIDYRDIGMNKSRVTVSGDVDFAEVIACIFSEVNNYPNFYQSGPLVVPENLNNEKPVLSCIVALTHNEQYVLKQAIPALFKNTRNVSFEVIIVNNDQCSKKEMFAHLPVRYFDAPDIFAVSRASNLGLRQAKGEYLAIFHDDACVLDDNWAEKCLEEIDSAEFAFLSGKEASKKDNSSYKDLVVTTPLLMFNKKLVQKFGYFDESIYIGHEEEEYGARLLVNNIKAVLAPCAVFHYAGGSSLILDSINPDLAKQLLALNILGKAVTNKIYFHRVEKISRLAIDIYSWYWRKKYTLGTNKRKFKRFYANYSPEQIKSILNNENPGMLRGNQIFNKYVSVLRAHLNSASFRPVLEDFLAYISEISQPCFSLGGGLSQNYICAFVLAGEKYPEWFNPGLEITSIFDCFPGLIWNGGRVVDGSMSLDEAIERVNFFNQRSIGVNFTFTNSLLTEEHIQDALCNKILKMFETSLNSVIVNSPLLEAHIRQTCPQYKIISSVSKCIYDKEKLIADTKKYDLVVIPPEYNFDLDFLRALPPDKVEIILNETCPPHCPEREAHYNFTDKLILGQIPQKGRSWGSFVPCKKRDPTMQQFREMMILELSDVWAIFQQTKIKNFKFIARGENLSCVTQRLTKYFVRQEYQNAFGDYMRDHAEDRELWHV
jgi:GT2 family glycosyltransferase